ncbi:MAG: TrmH family RNA methyltransferase [Phocaeicola sp.]
MLSKNKLKLIRSLETKKKRKEEALFVAEGPKLVGDLLDHFSCQLIVATASWLEGHSRKKGCEYIEVTQEELARASFQKTPQEVLALFEQPSYTYSADVTQKGLCLALDDVQDPGNLGTIIRIADWFGIEHIFCSLGTVDVYSPKTVQATMGALARVKVHYVELPTFLHSLGDTPLYGTFLDGEVIYKESLSNEGVIVMGNEGKGVSAEVERALNKRLYIPNYPAENETSESLNVAVATAIVCAEFRRQKIAPSFI